MGKITVTCPREECRATFSFEPAVVQSRAAPRPTRRTSQIIPILILTGIFAMLVFLVWPVATNSLPVANSGQIVQSTPETNGEKSAQPVSTSPLEASPQTSESDKSLTYRDAGMPKRWRLGDVDSRFNIDDEDVRQSIKKAIQLWESAAGEKLFEYDETLGFPIGLTFDSRQEEAIAHRTEKLALGKFRAEMQALKSQVKIARSDFENSQERLRNAVEDHNSRLRSYNEQVRRWNTSGDAPDSVVSELNAEKVGLQRESERLRSQDQEVEGQLDRLNQKIARANDAQDRYNAEAQSFNEKYRDSKQVVGECLRDSSSVESVIVYAFEDQQELTRIMAHELGHALGLDHVKGDGALMSAVEDGAKGASSLKLTERDRKALRSLLNL